MNDEISIPPNSLVALARAEIDQQISTARAYPRDVKKAASNITTLSILDEETAAECMYALPRGDKPIMGPSIRLAEIIVSQWGNCRAVARVVDVNRSEKYIEAEGVFHDLETNSATSARVRRRISNSRGGLYNDDMIIMTGNAACSIAKRNAILAGVPKAVWRNAYDSAERRVAGDVKVLAETRQKSLAAFAQFGVKPDRVLAAMGYTATTDITHKDIAVLRGMYAALKNAEATVEEMFGVLPTPAAAETKAPAAQAEAKTETKPEPAQEAKPVTGDDFPGDRQATAVTAPARRGPPPPPQAKPVVEPDKEPAKPEISQAEPADNQADEANYDLDVVLHDMKLDLAKARSEKAVLQLLDDNERAVNAMNPAQSKILSDAVKAARAKFSNRSAA